MRRQAAALSVITAAALAGCGSVPAVLPSSGGSPAASPSATVCASTSCAIATIQQSLVGVVAKDNSVMTAVKCKPSSLKENAGDTWTAQCTVTYSDGAQWSGYGNMVPAKDSVTFEPEEQVRQADGG
jgi:hypothetical protein